MSYSIEKDVIVNCDECIIDINKKLKEKRKFKIIRFQKYLCSLKQELKIYLKNGNVDTELILAIHRGDGFFTIGPVLSNNAFISPIDDKHWEVTDNSKKYIIEDLEEQLNVFLLNTKEESRKKILKIIINILFNQVENSFDNPKLSRDIVTKKLLKHGQFTEEEIDNVFKEHSFETIQYTQEFERNHPEIDVNNLWSSLMRGDIKESEMIKETKYTFYETYYCIELGMLELCKIKRKVKMMKCPYCGRYTTNTPDNITPNYDLICRYCNQESDDEFDTTGIIIPGRPRHHGVWQSQKPEFLFSGTDYFGIIHPKCKKSVQKDNKGIMEVNGIWIDDCGRIILGLECKYCGARNALKPFLKNEKIPLLDVSGATWKRVKSPILELIDLGESHKVEFKSSLRWDYVNNKANKKLEYDIARSICGFYNTYGGFLLIGVSDLKEILGIKKDYLTLGKGKKNRDGFELQLTEIINKFIGKEFRKLLRVSFDEISYEEICYIEIKRSPKPCFLNKNDQKEFLIRAGNRTQSLNVEETTNYINTHWKDTNQIK